MDVKITTPTLALLYDYEDAELAKLKKYLTFKDKSALYQMKKLKGNKWFRENRPDEYRKRLSEVLSILERCLVVNEGLQYFLRPSQITHLPESFEVNVIEDSRAYPEASPIRWKNPFPHTPYEYQEGSVNALIAERHANAELCTGSGKTYIIMELARRLGLRCVIVTPSVSIWREIYNDMTYHFGEEYVGAYCGVKKKMGKLITVAVSDSIAKLKEGSSQWNFFRDCKVAIFDESHTLPADTLAKMCNRVLEMVPYRFFLSGTQTDPYCGLTINDIIGKNVWRLTTRDAIQNGYICDLDFRIVRLNSHNPRYQVKDPSKMKRMHFNENMNIAGWTARLANSMWNGRNESTLILVNDIWQLSMLKDLVTVPFNYIHGNTISKAEMEKWGLRKVDLEEELFRFNTGQTKVLAGTKSISTGTNIYPTHNTVNWQGGASEIATRQGAIGRSVRKLETSKYAKLHIPKLKTKVWDFDVHDINILVRHLNLREAWYKDATDNVRRI